MLDLETVEAGELLDEAAIDVELVSKCGLFKFVEIAWHVVDASGFVGGWHVEEMCRHLEAVSRGELRRLIINVPPGMSKSLITSVFWPAWDWITSPWRKWMFATFDPRNTNQNALRCRQLVTSPWFQDRWGDSVAIYDGDEKQRTMGLYHTLQGGSRYSTTPRGGGLGQHAHIQVVDDPTKADDVREGGEVARHALDRTADWWRNTMASRKADPKTFSRVIIMQRLHEDDLAGVCAKEGGWEVLRLPMRFEADDPCTTSIGGDRRFEDGELLCPDRFDEQAVAESEREMGPMIASAQLQQRPAPAAGALFQRDWLIKEWDVLPRGVQLFQSWDCSFKDTDTADYVVGTVWGLCDSNFYLIDLVRDRMNLPATCAAIKSISAKYPSCITKLIEDKANGPAVEQVLRGVLSGVVMINPEGGKIARANACTGLFKAGNVFVPSAARAPWVHVWREEMAQFPKGRHDDQVDSTTQALIYMHGNPQVDADTITSAGERRWSDRRLGLMV